MVGAYEVARRVGLPGASTGGRYEKHRDGEGMKGEDDEGGDDPLGSCKVERRGLPAFRDSLSEGVAKGTFGVLEWEYGFEGSSQPTKSKPLKGKIVCARDWRMETTY